LHNPDTSDCALPFNRLKRVIIATADYDFLLLERFVTYAVNYIGQKHLKHHVEVDIYGSLDGFHPHLYNNFSNCCKHVTLHDPLSVSV